MRTHSTYGEFDSTQPLPELSSSRSSSLGDVRLIGSYQGILPTHNLGVQLGVKLPTGQYGTAVDFYGGPNAGTPLDASLQPGYRAAPTSSSARTTTGRSARISICSSTASSRARCEHHMDQPGNDYRPGNSTTVSFGLRYEAHPRWVPQLQVNLLHKSPRPGRAGGHPEHAGNVAYVSPGLTAMVAQAACLWFAQVPVYSNLYGYQLFPRWTASFGASYAL